MQYITGIKASLKRLSNICKKTERFSALNYDSLSQIIKSERKHNEKQTH